MPPRSAPVLPYTTLFRSFQPEGMNVRMSGGQPSYSHVVTVSGTGKIVYTAGQLARDIDGNCVGKGDMRAQMEQTFKNLDQCLKDRKSTRLNSSHRCISYAAS